MENNEDKIILESIYHPSTKELDFISRVYKNYYKWRANLSTPWSQFENLSVREYIKSARDKFNGIVPIDPLIDRKKFISKEFRNSAEQVMTFVANLVQNPEFYGENILDQNISSFLNALIKVLRRGTTWKILDAYHFLQTIIDGTGIVYVSWNPRKRKVKNIKYFDDQTGEVKFEEQELKENSIEEIWVDPLDIFIPKIFEPNIDKQGELIWRKFMTWKDFKRRYGNYPLSKNVYPGSRLSDESLFSEFLDKTLLTSDKIEIIQYYNTEEDEYGIIANGVFLNPVKSTERKSKVSPLPWNHKELPFAKTIYRFTSPALFWGASLMHIIKDEVDAFNELIEMGLNRIYKAINPPIVTNDFTIPNNLELESGKLYVSRGQWKELNMGTLDPNVWNLSAMLQNQILRGVTPLTPPSQPTRQPKSASEILSRQQRELQSYQTQKTFYQDLMEQKIWLTAYNGIQFLTSEQTRRMIGNEKFEKTLFVDNIQTPVGFSSLEIRIKPDVSPPEKLFIESIIKSIQKKKKVEIIEISPEALQNLKFDVDVMFNVENTPELKKALFSNFIQQIMAMFPDLIDKKKLLIRLFEVYNENPIDYLADNIVPSLFIPQFQQQQQLLSPQQGQSGQGINQQIIQAGQRGPMGGIQNINPSLKDLINLGIEQ
jgi:hypothetical protein